MPITVVGRVTVAEVVGAVVVGAVVVGAVVVEWWSRVVVVVALTVVVALAVVVVGFAVVVVGFAVVVVGFAVVVDWCVVVGTSPNVDRTTVGGASPVTFGPGCAAGRVVAGRGAPVGAAPDEGAAR